jgi:hypothetical protein
MFMGDCGNREMPVVAVAHRQTHLENQAFTMFLIDK